MKKKMYICTVLAFVLNIVPFYAQIDWHKTDNEKGGFSFATPEKPKLRDTVNVNFYNLEIEGLVLQVHFVDSVAFQSNEISEELLHNNDGDELRAQAQFMQMLTHGELISIKDLQQNGNTLRRGVEFGLKYTLNEEDNYTFCRLYNWRGSVLCFTITGDVYRLDKLLTTKLDFFDSITFK
jgi:hypothetical protein